MKIKISYSKYELEKAIDYCWTHNPYWQRTNQTKDDIRLDFVKSMHRLATNRNIVWVGAGAGCLLIPDLYEEDMDNDENVCYISIYVPPSFDRPYDSETDVVNEMASVSGDEYWKDYLK